MSPSTILRSIRNKKFNIVSNYKIVGIDDWAFRKGHTYGTLICDLETNKPIDILEEKTSEVLEKWLTVEIITRDRA
ncbi:TPA: transposase [Clostridium botulinum]|nr:transposase [Clostridium botulinum]